MKKILSVLAVSLLSAFSVSSFAQSAQDVQTLNSYGNYAYSSPTQSTKTRAEVRQELVDLEKAGYNPAESNADDYPQNIQRAEKIVWQEHHQAQQ